MSVLSVLIGLQGWRAEDRGTASDDFVARWDIQPGELQAAPWAGGMIELAVVRQSAYAHLDTTVDAGAQSEAFDAGLIEALHGAAQFLDRRSPALTAALRADGFLLQLLIDVRMDQDQMELVFPPALLAACGRHDLGVYVITNDVAGTVAEEG